MSELSSKVVATNGAIFYDFNRVKNAVRSVSTKR